MDGLAARTNACTIASAEEHVPVFANLAETTFFKYKLFNENVM